MASREATVTSRVQNIASARRKRVRHHLPERSRAVHKRCLTPFPQLGPEGLEPSPRWLRARYAAANTWIPFGPEGVEPSSGPYKEPALAISYGPSGAGGSRTHTLPLKRRIRCHYATAPNRSRTYRFKRVATNHIHSPQVVRGGIAPPPATYQIAMLLLHHQTKQ